MTAIPLWRTQRERGSRLLMRMGVSVALCAGRSFGRALLFPACAYFFVFSRRARGASRDYLTRILGRAPSWLERFRHYHCFARQILDRVYLLRGDLERFKWTLDGLPALEAAIAHRRGVLLIGAHVGSFEMLRVLALARFPVRVRVLMHEANAEKLASVLAPLNPEMARQVIVLGRPETMLETREALAAGDAVGLLADRVVAGDRVRRCAFLGAPALFAEGPFVLAASLDVPVVLFSAIQDDQGTYRVRFEPFAVQSDVARSGRDAAIQAACERYARWLEARCREAPYNWFNFYDFWSDA